MHDPGYLMHVLWKDKPTFLYRSISATGGSSTISMVHASVHQFLEGGALMYVVVYNWHLRGWTWLLCNYLIGPVAWCSFWVCCWLFVTVWFKRMGCWHIFAHSPNTSSTHSFPVNNLWWPYILAYEVSRPNFLDLFLWRHFRQSLLNAICMLWPEHCSSHVPIEGHFPF
jgi:hypothetical protein